MIALGVLTLLQVRQDQSSKLEQKHPLLSAHPLLQAESTWICAAACVQPDCCRPSNALPTLGAHATPPGCLQHPQQLEQCKQDPAMWPRAVEELLRFHTASSFALRRVAKEPVPLPNGQVQCVWVCGCVRAGVLRRAHS